MSRKLIYILNNYSKSSTEHFFHVINLLEEISKSGVLINLIIEKADEKPELSNENIKVFILKNKGIARLPELYKLISKFQKDGYLKLFVRITNFGASVAIINSFFKKLDVYYWHSGTVFEFDNKQRFSFTKVKWYFRTRLPFNFIKRFVTFFVTGPESMKDYYVNNVGVKQDKIRILYNDIDTSRFNEPDKIEKLSIKQRLNIKSDEQVILFVHKFSPVRRSEIYISTFIKKMHEEALSKNYRFYFIGDGKDKENIYDEIVRLKLDDKVCFLGSLPNAEVHLYYQIADIFINPTYAEGFPRVLIEAMACGLPIVTTNAGGIKDILGPIQNNYMSDINDPDGFANNLMNMIELSQEDLIAIKEENLHQIERFSTGNVALMYINTIFNG